MTEAIPENEVETTAPVPVAGRPLTAASDAAPVTTDPLAARGDVSGGNSGGIPHPTGIPTLSFDLSARGAPIGNRDGVRGR